jgi:hypothetical protein
MGLIDESRNDSDSSIPRRERIAFGWRQKSTQKVGEFK